MSERRKPVRSHRYAREYPRPWRAIPVEMDDGTWLAYIDAANGESVTGTLAIPVEAAHRIVAAANGHGAGKGGRKA